MPSGSQVKALMAFVVVMTAAVLFLQGVRVGAKSLYSAFSYVVTGVTFLLAAWEKYLWHIWPFFYLQKEPDLRGTWKGQISSNYVDPNTQVRKPPIEVYVVVRQTCWTIDVRLFSAESSSVTLSGSLFSDSANVFTLACTYRNTPTVLRRQRSPISHGGLLLYVRGSPIHQLDGEYWTDRGTVGEMLLTGRSKQQAHDFAQAQRFTWESVDGLV